MPDPSGQDGQVVGQARLAVEVLRVRLHTDAMVLLDRVDLRDDLAVPGIDPQIPALREAPRFDAPQIPPGLRIDHQASVLATCRPALPRALIEGRALRDPYRVRGGDRRVMRTDHGLSNP